MPNNRTPNQREFDERLWNLVIYKVPVTNKELWWSSSKYGGCMIWVVGIAIAIGVTIFVGVV